MVKNKTVMELKDFVKETLLQITQGVKEAQKAGVKHGAVINPAQVYGQGQDNVLRSNIKDEQRLVQIIDFDVDLTPSDEDKKKKGIAGNIKFKIPVVLPSMDNENSPPRSYTPKPYNTNEY